MPQNILVVDDSSVMRKIVIKTLRLCGIEVGEIYEAANGQEGLDALRSKKVDVVLVDINMPVMGGVEMVEKVREDQALSKTPIVFISSESSSTKIEMLLKNGAGFVHKPFNPESLRENIINTTSQGNGNGKTEI